MSAPSSSDSPRFVDRAAFTEAPPGAGPRRVSSPVGEDSPDAGPRVRVATHDDVVAVVEAVGELLTELGSVPPPMTEMARGARALVDDPDTGTLLVAEAGGENAAVLVGVLGASYQTALHVPGRYALIQDLWVHPSWRGRAVGRELLSALFALARERGMARAEVGLPRENFAGIRATEAFYLHNDFAPLGARMRRIFS